MSLWNVEKHLQIKKVNSPILIAGLPGIGNVGKIAVDFMQEQLKSKQLYSFFSHRLPHSVFVNEQSMVELPKIELRYAKLKKKDLLFLIGDVQPIDEESCYEFCEKVLDIFQEAKGYEIITLGGIGLRTVPKEPKVYCTANSKSIIKRYKNSANINPKVYGVVGPIIGVSGLLLGLAGMRGIDAICLLAETYGHPMYIGLKEAEKLIKILDKKFSLNLNMKNLQKEIEAVESQFKDIDALKKVPESKYLKKLRQYKETNYIG
ncbi:PAC2 family protein [Candidatus Woesearchaeota archaeon]|nr:PAC2 family protein [Candidatus Woesearchaeota archaeon]